MYKRKQLALVGVTLIALNGCIIHVGGHDQEGNVSTILGGIDISQGRTVEDLSTVNGGIDLADGVTAEDVDTVNGGVEMGENVTVYNIDVVNGDVEAKANLTVHESIDTVNGDIELQTGAKIGRNLETVNGDISLHDAMIGGSISTLNGDITLAGATEVTGDIVYEEKDEKNWYHSRHRPTLTIDSDVVLHGNIILYQPVELKLADASMQSKVIERYTDRGA